MNLNIFYVKHSDVIKNSNSIDNCIWKISLLTTVLGGTFSSFRFVVLEIFVCINTSIRNQSIDLQTGNSTLLTKCLIHCGVSVSFYANGCVICLLLSSLLSPTSQCISEVCLGGCKWSLFHFVCLFGVDGA